MKFRYLIACAGLTVANPVLAKWREASSSHFVIYSEDSAKNLEEFARRLERFDKGMHFMYGLPEEPLGPANRVTVFVVPNQTEVRRLIGRKSSSIAGFYHGSAAGSVAFIPRSIGGSEYELSSQIVLLHEYSHHFMKQNYTGVVPGWYVEGFAEFNSTARFNKDGSIAFGMPAMHRAYGLILAVKIPVSTLLVSSSSSKMTNEQMDVFYGRGWLLTHYLLFEPARREQLPRYFAHLGKGDPPLKAAEAAFGDLKTLDRELDSYVRRPRMTVLTIPAEKLTGGQITVRDLSAAEEAVMQVRIQSKSGVSADEAKEVLAMAVRAAAPYPNDVFAQTTLAEAAFDAGEYAECEAAADRALAQDPKSTEALIYKGRARMEIAAAKDGPTNADWAEVRKWFLAANKVDPGDPEPPYLYYQSFLTAGLTPTANATKGLIFALEMAPEDDALRMLVGRQYLIDNNPVEARKTLTPIAYDPHGGGLSQQVQAVIASIDKGEVGKALEALGSAGEKNKEQ